MSTPFRQFNLETNTNQASQKKITTKTLCDITGTRYYEHNEDINLMADKIVRVFDENE